jgi:iron(III) transport system substrate-binding protein
MKRLVALLIFMVAAPSGMAQTQDWQQTWDETVVAAKEEGRVVVVGSPDPVMRNEIIPQFTARFGIPIEFIAGRSGQIAGRVRTERYAGIYAVDVFMSGATTTINVLYAEKMIDPLAPLLILPEVTDGINWKRGAPWFVDAEKQFVLMLFSSVDSLLFINTEYVDPEEMRSAADLLNPKWQGKIATDDPVVSGSGSNSSAHFYSQLGPEFVKKLYVDQRPGISRDRRQLTDWLARGTYTICLTCRADDMRELQREGFRLLDIYELSDMQNRVNSAPFLLTVADRAPHPNAARVFVNWLAGKEALEIYSRNYGAVTLRTDVDETHLDPRAIPRPGITYPDDTDLEWVTSGRVETVDKVRALLRNP